MRIGDLIRPDQVILDLRAASKEQLLQELARRAASALEIDQRTIFQALRSREDLGSTGLGRGFALPHARLGALPAPFALFVRLARPIDFAAIDDRPVDLVMLLLTPAREADQHLSILAVVSRPMREEAFVRRLRQASGALALHQILADG